MNLKKILVQSQRSNQKNIVQMKNIKVQKGINKNKINLKESNHKEQKEDRKDETKQNQILLMIQK